MDRPIKTTFAGMRAAGVRGILVYCCDYRCSNSIALMADRWPDEMRLSDIEPQFVCKAPAASAAPSDQTSAGAISRLA
jgi:hypothetical protein